MNAQFCEFVFLLLSYCTNMCDVGRMKDAGEHFPLPKRAPCVRDRKARPHPVGRQEKLIEVRKRFNGYGHSCHSGCDWCAANRQSQYRRARAAWRSDLLDWLEHDAHIDALCANEPDALEFLDELDEEYKDWDAERWTTICARAPGPDSDPRLWNIYTADDVAYAVYYGMDFQIAAWEVEAWCLNAVKKYYKHRDPALVGELLAEVEKTAQLRDLYYSNL